MALGESAAKKLAADLVNRLGQGLQDTPEFKEDLAKYSAHQENQRNEGKQLRNGKHSVKLAPLLAQLPAEQQPLGLLMNCESEATRALVSEGRS